MGLMQSGGLHSVTGAGAGISAHAVPATMPTVAVIGARRARQGTGHYIAVAMAKMGCRVVAIMTTCDASLRQATDALRQDGVILPDGGGYTCAHTMLTETQPDVLVIASPAPGHLEYIRMALEHRCHVLCEKPLFLPTATPSDDAGTCTDLIRRFVANRRYLAVNTQWPKTLPTFSKLYPHIRLVPEHIDSFAMRLCPESVGLNMLTDAAPHFLSMLYALCGAGTVIPPTIETVDMGERKLRVQFTLQHAMGQTRACLDLNHLPGQPKPAEYSINGAGVRRHIQMPGYLLSLENTDGVRVPMRDPLHVAAEDFIRQTMTGTPPDDGIRICMEQFGTLLAQAAQVTRTSLRVS